MRIWDINPGYLNRQSLLGEHRELHGIISIIVNGKKGYSRHPETIRWLGHGWALRQRHRILAAEMALRGYIDKSPVHTRTRKGSWPGEYIDEPFRQFQILEAKYINKEDGRIPLPKSPQQLWSHHRYSVLARDIKFCKKMDRDVARMDSLYDFIELAKILSEFLRTRPALAGLRIALFSMWKEISGYTSTSKGKSGLWSPGRLLQEIQRCALESENQRLIVSTALSELKAWISST